MPVGGKEPPSAASPLLVSYGTTFPPQKRWDNKAPANICFKKLLYIKHGLLCPRLRGGKGTGFAGSPWATENPVTRFPPGQRWWRQPPKGERFSLARRAVIRFSINWRLQLFKRRHHNPLNPVNLLNPLNPHARKGVSLTSRSPPLSVPVS